MITLVMGPQQAAGGDSLALQVSPTVPSGDVTLRATATLARPPGQEMAVWTIDGELAGTSSWTLVRRLADGRSVWQTGITVALAEGSYVVTVALRSMVDGASVTAVAGGLIPGEQRRLIYFMFGSTGDESGLFGNAGNPVDAGSATYPIKWGVNPGDPPETSTDVDIGQTGWALVQVVSFNADESSLLPPAGTSGVYFPDWTVEVPVGYISGSLLLQPVGMGLLMRRVGTANTGTYSVTAEVEGETLGPVTFTLVA